MPQRAIVPTQFAAAVQSAQGYRMRGASQHDAVTKALQHWNMDDEWHAPLLGFINDAPTAAEHWARFVRDNALLRVGNLIADRLLQKGDNND